MRKGKPNGKEGEKIPTLMIVLNTNYAIRGDKVQRGGGFDMGG